MAQSVKFVQKVERFFAQYYRIVLTLHPVWQ